MNGFMVHHGHTIPYMMKHRSHLDTSTHASAGKQVVSAKEGMEIEISFRSLNILSCLLIGPRLPIPYATVSAPKKYLGGCVCLFSQIFLTLTVTLPAPSQPLLCPRVLAQWLDTLPATNYPFDVGPPYKLLRVTSVEREIHARV